MSLQLDAAKFHDRAGRLVEALFPADGDASADVDAMIVAAGANNDDLLYQKNTAIQTWLFGYEFPDTVLSISRDGLFALTSQKKAALLEQLNQFGKPVVNVETFKRNKDDANNAAMLKGFLEKLKGKKKIGVFSKDKNIGKFFDEWNAGWIAFKTDVGLEEIDVSPNVATVMASKDSDELKLCQAAAQISALVMKNYLSTELASIVDEDRSITHEQLAEKVEGIITDEKNRRKLKLPAEIDVDLVDACYTPIIQSGGEYDLKPSAQSNENKLRSGVVIASAGFRYKSYCSNVGRTYLFDPTKTQENNYKLLLDLQQHLMQTIKAGMTGAEIYNAAVAYLQEKNSEFVNFLPKMIGFVTGLEFRESAFLLNAKSDRPIPVNAIVNLAIGFQGLENPEAKKSRDRTYALFIADTVRITETGLVPLTGEAPLQLKEVAYFFKSESDDDNNVKNELDDIRTTRTTILKAKTRGEAKGDEVSNEQKRKEHQKQLFTQLQQAGIQRFSAGGDNPEAAPKQVFRRFESYKKDNLLPREVRAAKLMVDKRADSIIVPIFGYAVPFHINTLKNVTKSEEGEYVYLRFNFNTPGQITKKDETLPFDDPNATFIRSFSFRSTDSIRYNELYKDITEMRKQAQKKEADRRERADLVEQDRLAESKRPIAVLQDVTIRPALEGKKLPGDVQIHANGLRYMPIRGDQKVDILFSNIQHLFFQPCDNELYVILHCHLVNPIMVGKKKTKDVQFIREASEMAVDDTNNRRRRMHYGDDDELMAEQEERRRRQKLNKEFKLFAEKIAEVSGVLEADVPIRELGFNGVPARSNVFLQPTTECLVHLSEPPFLVVTLAEVEIAYLERVQFHLKNFDIVFVLKDFKKTPIHINSIPMSQLENIKEWLDSVDIAYIEGPLNLNWTNIMKTVNEDPAGFYEDGGWMNLASEDHGTDMDDDEESASEFEASSSDFEESDDESAFSEEDSEGSEEFSDEEDGEDWDELEKKARRSDEKKGAKSRSREEYDESDDDDRPKKKKR